MQNNLNLYEIVEKTEWQSFLQDTKNKKIIVFGATSIAEEMVKFLPFKVDYYVDNDCKKWGKDLNGISIFDPQVLLNENEEIAVLVTSSFLKEITEQIKSFNISKYIIIDLGKMFIKLKAFLQLDNYKADFERFVLRMPKLEEFKKHVKSSKCNLEPKTKPIGVVIYSYIFTLVPFYFMTIAALLKYQGHNVIIIWDDVNKHSDMLIDWQGSTEYQNEQIKESINLLSSKLKLQVIKVSDMPEAKLDVADKNEINRLAELNTIWKYRASSMRDELLHFKEEYANKLTNNLKSIKSLFNRIDFQRLIVFTGIYDCMGLYSWMGKVKGIEVASCDIGPEGGFLSTNAPCGHMMDVKKILKEYFSNIEIKEKFVELGRQKFKENIASKGRVANGVCQEISYYEDRSDEEYNIIIPLNVGWDAAALGKSRFFSSIRNWVIETVDFILKHTNATVAIRQHPAEKNQVGVNHNLLKYKKFEEVSKSGEDLFLELNKKFEGNKRFRYVRSEENVNTYRLIEKAELILPYTSTIALEAVMMKKNVIIESDAYYGDITAIKKANSKEDYFNKILQHYKHKSNIRLEDIEEVEFAYGITRHSYLQTEFTPSAGKWLNRSIIDLLDDASVVKTLKVLGEGVPLAVLHIEDFLKK
ncbi:hypothetical protein [Clostridium formicaceticum]|nr:hypothetical protein [Clostridium formicaceticum]